MKIRSFLLQNALHRFLAFARPTLDMKRMQFGVIAVAHDDTHGIELNHGFKGGNQRGKHIRQVQMRTDGSGDLEDGWITRLLLVLEEPGRLHRGKAYHDWDSPDAVRDCSRYRGSPLG